MSLDILNPVILKEIDSIGGFCIVPTSKIDYENYFPVDASKIGVVLYEETWTYEGKGPGSVGRDLHSGINYNDKLYIFGGDIGAGYTNSVWSYEYETKAWTLLSSGVGPAARQGSGGCVFGDDFYIFGGSSGSSTITYYNDLWKFNMTTNTWTQVHNGVTGAPIGRQQHGLVELNGFIYVIGGVNGTTRNQNRGDMFRWDIINGGWTQKASIISAYPTGGTVTPARGSCVVCNGAIYLYGGRKGDDTSVNYDCHLKYDPVSNSWSRLDPGPIPLYIHSATQYNNKIYIYGGRNNGSTQNRVWVFDTVTEQWSEGASGPKRSSHVGVMNVNRMYVHDGDQHDGELWSFLAEPDSQTISLTAAVKRARR